jgi:hypothetical protein
VHFPGGERKRRAAQGLHAVEMLADTVDAEEFSHLWRI